MTVAEWVTTQSADAPDALRERILRALAADGSRPASAIPDACLATAARELERVLVDQRFERDGALDLLTVDALMTYAFEYAATVTECDIDRLSADAIVRMGGLVGTT